MYCYGIWQPLFEKMESEFNFLIFHEGIPSKIEISNFSSELNHSMIILDDLMDEVLKSREMEMLFIRGCHHQNLSCIFLTQNIFSQSKHSRTITLNTNYMVLFRNFRDSSQIKTLARQIYPGKVKFLEESYNDATKKKYGYLLIDMSPQFR